MVKEPLKKKAVYDEHKDSSALPAQMGRAWKLPLIFLTYRTPDSSARSVWGSPFNHVVSPHLAQRKEIKNG